MVALSRAMVSGARVLLIDEVSLGLAPVVMAEVLAMVEELAAGASRWCSSSSR